MNAPRLSIVIPTRDRVDKLQRTLEAIFSAPAAVELEVVVVNDGSSDGTRALLDDDHFGDSLRSVDLVAESSGRNGEVRGQGPARARNRGIELARGERILLLGDDTRPAASSLTVHLEGQGGVQGRVEWEPEELVTKVMEFLAPEGPQFYFRDLVAGEAVPYPYVLGTNLSAPREWFLAEPYDEGFPDAAFEDTELAYRWQARGWPVIYRPGAICFHSHLYAAIEPFVDKQIAAGAAARTAVKRHRRLLFELLAPSALFDLWRLVSYPVRKAFGRASQEDRWWLDCRLAFWRGFFVRSTSKG